MTNAFRWIKQFTEKNYGQVCRTYLKEMEAQHTATSPSMA